MDKEFQGVGVKMLDETIYNMVLPEPRSHLAIVKKWVAWYWFSLNHNLT